ncbi:N-formylglutamate amidohydrolase [Pontibacter toksunensis]|uniref:N-formylglutamate amidohydrolase n=1 Tax=Pontibacter toksunensis TaxID=1332631 RepID=A0ABW6BPI0_9BACT
MLTFVLTCEHGGNRVPVSYVPLFKGHQDLLASHRGYDIGAKELYEELQDLAEVHYFADTTRLLVELNRSLRSKTLFSSVTDTLPEREKERIIEKHYYPYRQEVERKMKELIMAQKRLLHISVHSFTPVLEGKERQADVGLLFDPARQFEKSFCNKWKSEMQKLQPDLWVRYNYPYLGISDGFPTYLRRIFPEKQYSGIELEINQKFPLGDKMQWYELRRVVKESLQQVLTSYCHS